MKTHSVKLSKYAIGCLFLSLFSYAANAYSSTKQNAAPSHSHTDIIQQARQFLSQNIDAEKYSRTEIQMGKLDHRLKLAQCSTPLISSKAPGSKFSGKTTVHVKCIGDTPWTVFINANISLYSNVVHTSEPLDKGHILTKADLALTEVNLSQLRYGYFSDTKSLIGKQLKRRMQQNKIIRVNYVKAPTLVKRGELVSIVAENTGYSVKMSGKALANGGKGDRIQVKNISSKRIVEGTVMQYGVVSIN